MHVYERVLFIGELYDSCIFFYADTPSGIYMYVRVFQLLICVLRICKYCTTQNRFGSLIVKSYALPGARFTATGALSTRARARAR